MNLNDGFSETEVVRRRFQLENKQPHVAVKIACLSFHMAASGAIPILTLLGGLTGCGLGAEVGCAVGRSLETEVPRVCSAAAVCVVGGVGGAATGAGTGAVLDAFRPPKRKWS